MHTFATSARLTLAMCLLLCLGYAGILWGFGKMAGPNHGLPAVTRLNGQNVGTAAVGQSFTRDTYFWGRPSCAGKGYDATASDASQVAPSNPLYLQTVKRRVAAFLKSHPYLKREEVPAEMVTASGSGLDPDISPTSAKVQVRRVAQARHLPARKVKQLVDHCTERPLWGLLGPARVNVLQLNIALDQMQAKGGKRDFPQ